MTQDEIIEMAKQVGMDYIEYISEDSMKQVKAFAHLVAAKEREACAELRNMLHGFDGKGRQEMVDAMNRGLDEYQALIKARGQA
jgi:hypothetical protein